MTSNVQVKSIWLWVYSLPVVIICLCGPIADNYQTADKSQNQKVSQQPAQAHYNNTYLPIKNWVYLLEWNYLPILCIPPQVQTSCWCQDSNKILHSRAICHHLVPWRLYTPEMKLSTGRFQRHIPKLAPNLKTGMERGFLGSNVDVVPKKLSFWLKISRLLLLFEIRAPTNEKLAFYHTVEPHWWC